MSDKDTIKKIILADKGKLSDDEWMDLFSKARKLPDWIEFKNTLAGSILCQMCGMIKHKRGLI